MRERQGRSWVGRVLGGALLAVLIGGLSACVVKKTVVIPGGQVVLWEDACDDEHCGTQGDDIRLVKRKDPLIASEPSKFLGAKMNPDALGEAPKACGGQIDPNQWGQRANVHQTVGMGEAQGARIKEHVSAEIARELKKIVSIIKPDKKASLAPVIAQIAEESVTTNQSVDVATYSLSPKTFQAQVKACGGQTPNAKVVRSLTVARIGIDASQRIRNALEKRISANIELRDALISPADPTVRVIVNRIVGFALANYTYVIAVGFDSA